MDNFFSHNATTRVNRAWGEGPLLMQAAIRAHDLDDLFATPPIRIGAGLWCGIDHQRGYHPDPFWGGLLDAFRIPRYSYELFKSQYPPDYRLPGIRTGPMVFISHELTQVSGRDVIVYSNCKEVRLTWLGKVVGTQTPDAGYHALPHPPFTFTNAFDFGVIKSNWRERTGEIEMIAEGIMDGKIVARGVKKYAERTTAVNVTIDDAGVGLTADGSDFVPVRATIVDNKGVPKVLASEYVYFVVEGPGEIIGGPGSQANPARTEFGTATALLRATTKPGMIKVARSSKVLLPAKRKLPPQPRPVRLPTMSLTPPHRNPQTRQRQAVVQSAGQAAGDMQKLKDEVHRLQLQLTSKEQDLMELRSKINKKQ